VFLVPQLRVHHQSQYLATFLWDDRLAFDRIRAFIGAFGMAREVYDDRLVFLKRRSAPSFPPQCFVDDSLKACSVGRGCRTRHPGRVVIDKGDRPTFCINLALHEVCVEEKEQHR
jgi:hypothetical protein